MKLLFNILRFGAIAGVIAWAGYTFMTPGVPPSGPVQISVATTPPTPTTVAPAPIVAAPAPAPTPSFALPAPKVEPVIVDVKAVAPPPSTEITIGTAPLEGGRVSVAIKAPARANEPVQVTYGGATFVLVLDGAGEKQWTLDAFAGSQHPMRFRFRDGTLRDVAVVEGDLGSVSKIAIVWQAPVNLDLHAFEYAAKAGDAGHIWAGSGVPIIRAREIARAGTRARGAMTMHDDGTTLGDKVEVYTIYHSPNEVVGSIAFAVDYETRGDRPDGNSCGQAPLATVPFTVVTLSRNGPVHRESGVLGALPCGAVLSREQRLDTTLLPQLRIKP